MLQAVGIAVLGNSQDVLLLALFVIGRNWDVSVELLNSDFNIKLVIDIAKMSILLFGALQVYLHIKDLQEPDTGSEDVFSRPLLFPCRTSHTRMFPTKHSFSYSYFVVGIPVGWEGSSGGMISADAASDSRPIYKKWLSPKLRGAWFTVNGDDYLARGHVDGGLKEKLHDFLRTQVRFFL